ncbi:MAG: GNAT family N-acetyltransferase [Deltaproteobacteria bacterium]|nr:GNAT family N-acetyltransferase [Deltaproteobacteria bacterium]MBI3076421.1 GNAT family N-acetyltransferase [Deltaproteobacteria bacterium]
MSEPGMTVRLHHGLEGLQALRPGWRGLYRQLKRPNVFLSWTWLHTWWTHFAGARELVLATVERDGLLEGVAAFVRTPPTPTVELAWDPDLWDFADVLALPGREEAVSRTLAEHLAGWAGWQTLVLHALPEDSPTGRLWSEWGNERGWKVTLVREEVTPYLPLPPTWEAYLAMLSSKDRHELRRKLRRAEAAGPLRLEVATRPEAVRPALETFFDLFQRHRKAAFLVPERRAFFGALVDTFAPRKWVELALLWVGDQPAAGLFSFVHGGAALVYNSAYDPALAPFSPGLACFARYITHCQGLRRKELEFLRGDEPYKYDLGARDRWNYRLTVVRPEDAS